MERRGDRVVFLNELRFRDGTALRMSLPLTRTELPAIKAVAGRHGSVEGTDYRGVPVFAAAQPVPGTSWYVIAKLDSAEVLAPVRTRGVVTAVVVAALVVADRRGALPVLARRVRRRSRPNCSAANAATGSCSTTSPPASWCTRRTPGSCSPTPGPAISSA